MNEWRVKLLSCHLINSWVKIKFFPMQVFALTEKKLLKKTAYQKKTLKEKLSFFWSACC